MEKKLENGLSIRVIDLPIPILKYPKWVEITYPQTLKEAELLALLKRSLPEIEKFAKESEIKQIKLPTDPSWTSLTQAGLTRTVYYLTIKTSSLTKITTQDYPVIELKGSTQVKDLIRGQFLYHCQYKPIYFTCEIDSRVDWFINRIQESIKKKEGFLLGVELNQEFAGFIYGEFEENEGCVDELFVEEKSRGKGLGKLLVREAGGRFLARGLETVGVFVGIDEESLSFYENLGFKKEFVNWIKNL